MQSKGVSYIYLYAYMLVELIAVGFSKHAAGSRDIAKFCVWLCNQMNNKVSGVLKKKR